MNYTTESTGLYFYNNTINPSSTASYTD